MMDDVPKLYKWLRTDGRTLWGKRDCSWPLPATPGKPGQWMPKLTGAELRVCVYGYHAFTADKLAMLLPYHDAMLVEVELRAPIQQNEKWLARQGRIIRVIFATNAGGHFLALYHTPWLEDVQRREEAWLAFDSRRGVRYDLDAELKAALAASTRQYQQELDALLAGGTT